MIKKIVKKKGQTSSKFKYSYWITSHSITVSKSRCSVKHYIKQSTRPSSLKIVYYKKNNNIFGKGAVTMGCQVSEINADVNIMVISGTTV